MSIWCTEGRFYVKTHLRDYFNADSRRGVQDFLMCLRMWQRWCTDLGHMCCSGPCADLGSSAGPTITSVRFLDFSGLSQELLAITFCCFLVVKPNLGSPLNTTPHRSCLCEQRAAPPELGRDGCSSGSHHLPCGSRKAAGSAGGSASQDACSAALRLPAAVHSHPGLRKCRQKPAKIAPGCGIWAPADHHSCDVVGEQFLQ